METKNTKPRVVIHMAGPEGNAYVIMGRAAAAMRENGMKDKIQEMTDRATSGDYNNLLKVVGEYVNLIQK